MERSGQLSIFDLDSSTRYYGKPDYGDNRDEIVRLSIEDKFERAIPLYKCCNTVPKGMFQSCTAYCVRCPVCKTQTKFYKHYYEANKHGTEAKGTTKRKEAEHDQNRSDRTAKNRHI